MLIVTDPTTGEIVRRVEAADTAEMNRILGAADGAFDAWRGLSFAERAAVLRAVAERMRADVERLAPIMTEEMGKPIREARGEVAKSAWCAEHYADHAEGYLAPQEIGSDATRSYVQYLPLGVILGILPWNAPFWLAFRFAAPALMAGNTCVIKHDPHVPGCGEAIAASEIKPTVLELGGSDPSIVLADADLEKAADAIALMRIINAGQSCIAAKRILVEAPVHNRMVSLLEERLGALAVGDPRDEATDVGPIAREDLREALHRQVRETVDAGARCLMGGEIPDGPGYFYPVTLLTEVTPEMTASREETFGPVGVVTRVRDADEALRLANDTRYGLAASVWTTAERGEAMAREIVAGQVAVNGVVKTDPRLPSGGVKRSGYGRELGPHGIHEFVNAQQVWIGPARG